MSSSKSRFPTLPTPYSKASLKKKKESRENMTLWADWATQRTPLITSDIQSNSLFHLAISSGSDIEQEIRCLCRMLLRMVLLNTGFTKAEEPNYLWSPEKKSSSSKWRAISWGSNQDPAFWGKSKVSIPEHKGGDWASIYRGQLWQRKLLQKTLRRVWLWPLLFLF